MEKKTATMYLSMILKKGLDKRTNECFGKALGNMQDAYYKLVSHKLLKTIPMDLNAIDDEWIDNIKVTLCEGVKLDQTTKQLRYEIGQIRRDAESFIYYRQEFFKLYPATVYYVDELFRINIENVDEMLSLSDKDVELLVEYWELREDVKAALEKQKEFEARYSIPRKFCLFCPDDPESFADEWLKNYSERCL